MKDIRIDSDGNLRCYKCGSREFNNKRTFRSKAIAGTAGVVTLGVAAAAAPLATKKKMQCKACGEYNDTGSAKPWAGTEQETKEAKKAQAAADWDQMMQNRRARKAEKAALTSGPLVLSEAVAEPTPLHTPTEAKGLAAKMYSDGTTITIKKPMAKPNTINSADILAVHRDIDWSGTLGIYIETATSTPPKKLTGTSSNLHCALFGKAAVADAEALLASIGH